MVVVNLLILQFCDAACLTDGRRNLQISVAAAQRVDKLFFFFVISKRDVLRQLKKAPEVCCFHSHQLVLRVVVFK